jgi:hypothetical protein
MYEIPEIRQRQYVIMCQAQPVHGLTRLRMVELLRRGRFVMVISKVKTQRGVSLIVKGGVRYRFNQLVVSSILTRPTNF